MRYLYPSELVQIRFYRLEGDVCNEVWLICMFGSWTRRGFIMYVFVW